MSRVLFFVFLLVLLPLKGSSQQFPAEGKKLHYRLIGFTFPPDKEATGFQVDIAKGKFNDESGFLANVVRSATGERDSVIAEVPDFAEEYTWRVSYAQKDGTVKKSKFFHFSTLPFPKIDGGETRIRVMRFAPVYPDAWIGLDRNKGFFNMVGMPLWFIPPVTNIPAKAAVRDLKLSPRGTITFLAEGVPYEIDYNGKVLKVYGKATSATGIREERYHHEFTVLENGHSMVLGKEILLCKLPGDGGVRPEICRRGMRVDKNDRAYRSIEFSTLLEYDEKGKLVWSWKSSEHYKEIGFERFIKRGTGPADYNLHENSFFFDAQKKVAYISSKTFSLIIKVSYPEGNVLNVYGTVPRDFEQPGYGPAFCDQHCIRQSADGKIYLFDNNSCSNEKIPKVVVFQEPESPGPELEEIWEYSCPVEGENRTKIPEAGATSGGSVSELPDGSFYASLCSPYAFLLIVNKQKQLIWSAFPEVWRNSTQRWELLSQYRSSIITDRKKIEQMVWRGLTSTKNIPGSAPHK